MHLCKKFLVAPPLIGQVLLRSLQLLVEQSLLMLNNLGLFYGICLGLFNNSHTFLNQFLLRQGNL